MSPAPSKFKLFHEIFILDAYLQRPLDESKKDTIVRELISDLLVALRMDELGPLRIFPAADLRAPGFSFLMPITTSHIGGHYFSKPGRLPHLRMDVYSCASVNWRKMIDTVHKHLALEKWRGTFIDRQIGDESERMMWDMHGVGDQVIGEEKLFVPSVEVETVKEEPVLAAIT